MMLETPGLPQYRDELSSELHIPFIDGFIASVPQSVEERLIDRYRGILKRGQVSWRLSRLLNFDSIDDYRLLASVLHMALKKT